MINYDYVANCNQIHKRFYFSNMEDQSVLIAVLVVWGVLEHGCTIESYFPSEIRGTRDDIEWHRGASNIERINTTSNVTARVLGEDCFKKNHRIDRREEQLARSKIQSFRDRSRVAHIAIRCEKESQIDSLFWTEISHGNTIRTVAMWASVDAQRDGVVLCNFHVPVCPIQRKIWAFGVTCIISCNRCAQPKVPLMKDGSEGGGSLGHGSYSPYDGYSTRKVAGKVQHKVCRSQRSVVLYHGDLEISNKELVLRAMKRSAAERHC